MIIILPTGHEKTTVRRLPWVTFTIMGLCVLAYLFTLVSLSGIEEDMGETFRDATQRMMEAQSYYQEHPYLELDPRLLEDIPEELFEMMRQFGPKPPDNPYTLQREQDELDELVEAAIEAVDRAKSLMRERNPFQRWGLVPAHKTLHGIITYQFMHGGFWHLFGNLFILFLAGPFIEDVWGRPLFAGFYILAGILSGLLFAVHYPNSEFALIGASGSIAGVMGAFLIRYFKAKINFWFWILGLVGTFAAPAWLMLPLWVAKEFFFAQAWDALLPGIGGPVAHWAHVWGFVFGAGVAYGLKRYQVEERFIHEQIEAKITLVDNPIVDQALQAKSEGRAEEALDMLTAEISANPDNEDAVYAAWNIAMEVRRPAEYAPHLLRVVRKAARTGETDVVITHWLELLPYLGGLQVDGATALRIGEMLHEANHDDAAQSTLELVAPGISAATPPGVLVRLARLAAAVGSPTAGGFIALVKDHPELLPDVRAELDEIEGAAEAAPEAVPVPEPGEPIEVAEAEPDVIEPIAAVTAAKHTLRVMEAIPQRWSDTDLTIKTGDTVRDMSLDLVHAVAVGGVKGGEGRPSYLVVDLLLDPPWSESEALRTVRLTSTRFDPRSLMGVDDFMESYRAFLQHLLLVTEAVPLPDPDTARGRPFKVFDSLRDYERSVLHVE